jgi:hypothetical protein
MCVGVVVLLQMLTFVMIFLISTAPSTLSSVQLEEPLGLVCLEARGGRASGANSNLGIANHEEGGAALAAEEPWNALTETMRHTRTSIDLETEAIVEIVTGKCYGSA